MRGARRNGARQRRVRKHRAVSLSDAELERYARHIVLREVGATGQRKLKAASVALVGAGAIGSAALPALAGAGVGRLTVIDHDLVLDGSDNFVTRLAVNQACVDLAIPLVSAAAAQFQAQVALLRGWEAGQPCYRCFVGDAFDSDDCDTCAELGVLGALTGTAGHFAALLALRALLGIGDDSAGKLFLLDAAALNWREMKLPKDPGC